MALYQNFTTSSSGTITIPGPIIGTHTNNTLANIFTASGNVGIGTTNPAYTLDVNGTIDAIAYTGGSINLSGSIVAGGNINAIGNLTNGGFDFVLGNADQSARGNSGLSRALVKNTGSVLQINHNGDFTGGTQIQGSSLSHSGFFSATGNSNTLGNLVTTGGNIGIGVRTPSQIMHIQRSGSDNYIKVDAGSGGSNLSGIMLSEHNTNFGWSLRHDAGTDLLYISYQDNTPTFTNTTIFNRSGQIGINKTPGYTLDVNGNRLNLHSAAGTNGGQNLFEGIENSTSRSQIVLSSMYSDMVIASSQVNDFHGSTLTFASYNPTNKADYRKWVINQGNWGSRVNMLDFGYRTTVANPHDVIQDGFVTMTLDGTNQRVGIGNRNPTYKLDISQSTNAVDAYGLRIVTSTSTSGTARTYGLWVDASGSDDANYAAIFNTGNVGIGTAAPQTTLSVNGASHFLNNFNGTFTSFSGLNTGAGASGLIIGWNGLPSTLGEVDFISYPGLGTGGFNFALGNSAGSVYNNSVMRMTSQGNVGIGTVTPVQTLDVNGNINGSRLFLGNSTTGNARLNIRDISTNLIEFQFSTSSVGNISCFGSNPGLLFNGGGGTNQLVLASTGNIGIGTTSPGYKLHVNGEIYTTSFIQNYDNRSYKPSDISAGRFAFGFGSFSNNNTSPFADLISLNTYFDSSGGAQNLLMFNKSSIGMRIYQGSFSSTSAFSNYRDAVLAETNGNVTINGIIGIGTTQPATGPTTTIPNARLSILSGASGNNGGTSRISIGGDNSHYSAIEGAHTSSGATTLAFLTCLNASTNSANPLTRMFIEADGDVGIGTVTPAYRLDVNGVIRNNSDIIMDSSSRLTLYNNTGALQIRSGSTNTLFLNQDNTGNVAIVGGGGNVGIGTSSPGYKLDINGNCKVTNELYVGNAAGVGTIYMGGGASGDGTYDHSVIETRNYTSSENTELLLFKGNDTASPSGPDRIRLRAAAIAFDIHSGTTDRTAESIRMYINNSGDVGINTVSPGFKLHVNGNMRADNIYNNGWFRNYGDHGLYNEDHGCHFLRNDSQYGNWRIYGNAVNNWSGLRFTTAEISLMAGDSATRTCGFHYNNVGWALQVDSGRNLYIPGDITAYWSDRRLKTNLQKLDHFDDVLTSLTGYSFNWNEKGQEILQKPADELDVGLIAQDVQAVIPQAVKVNKAGQKIDEPDPFEYLTINYDKIVPFLIEGYKAQRGEIQAQKTQIQSQKNEISNLQSKLQQLEELIQQLLNK